MAEYVQHRGVVPPTHDELTVGQLVLAYLRHAQKYYGESSTSWGNVKTALAPVLTLYSRVPAAEFGPRALRAVRATWEADELSRTTVNKYTRLVKQAFRWAAAQQLIPVEIVTALDTVEGLRKGRSEAREPAPIEPVPEQDLEAVLAIAPRIVGDMIRIQSLCGARPMRRRAHSLIRSMSNILPLCAVSRMIARVCRTRANSLKKYLQKPCRRATLAA